MKTLSTGQPSTLKTYRDNTKALFGQDSPAVQWLNKRIEDQGEEEEVIADEGQMIQLIASIHFGGVEVEENGKQDT